MYLGKVAARNDDFRRIMRESEKVLKDAFISSLKITSNEEREFGALSSLDFLIFGGDLNYRIDLTRDEVYGTSQLLSLFFFFNLYCGTAG